MIADGARLVTLLGPPGVGKTRLALAVAEDVLEHFEHGAFFVRLAPIADPGQVAAAIAQALGLEITGPNAPERQVRAYLEEKHLLLVLDNFEHLVAAAPLVDDLLYHCPWLQVLVTSRQPLRVRGERRMTVRRLALPAETSGTGCLTAEDALRHSAVALFAERAEAVQHDFAVTDANAADVAVLCRRLDGLPLAIELVAARVKLLPPAELLLRLHGPWLLSTDGLRDVSERQRTLRGAIGWSYDLLSPVEQTLFTRLAVFVGGGTLEAAEMMCEDILSPAQVLDGITSLLDKNLLHPIPSANGGVRYAMLETLRDYGWEQLAVKQEDASLRSRHMRCFLRLVANAEQTTVDPGWIRVRHLLDYDLDNVRAAFAWARQCDAQAALLLAAALLEWHITQGPYSEGRRLIDDVFALPGASAHTIARVKALYKAGTLLIHDHDLGQAQATLDECRVLSQELQYDQGVADAMLGLGRLFHNYGRDRRDQDLACSYLEQALASYRLLGDAAGIAKSQVLLGQIYRDQGDFPRARRLFEDSLAAAQQAGFSWAWPMVPLCDMAIAEGDLDRAQTLAEDAIRILSRHKSTAMVAISLQNLGVIAVRQSNFPAARARLDQAQAIMARLDSTHSLLSIDLDLAELFQATGEVSRALEFYRRIYAAVEKGAPVWLGPFLLNLSTLAATLKLHPLAARLLSAIETASNVTGNRLSPDRRRDFIRLREETRAHLGAEHFEAAWSDGRQRPLEPLIEEALRSLETAVAVQVQVAAAP